MSESDPSKKKSRSIPAEQIIDLQVSEVKTASNGKPYYRITISLTFGEVASRTVFGFANPGEPHTWNLPPEEVKRMTLDGVRDVFHVLWVEPSAFVKLKEGFTYSLTESS